ncbi:MAG: hypothetical protein GY755_22665 [Chloroflexi bacterium]|nr:hypothetical protein [Chloroflexota bacterium]
MIEYIVLALVFVLFLGLPAYTILKIIERVFFSAGPQQDTEAGNKRLKARTLPDYGLNKAPDWLEKM